MKMEVEISIQIQNRSLVIYILINKSFKTPTSVHWRLCGSILLYPGNSRRKSNVGQLDLPRSHSQSTFLKACAYEISDWTLKLSQFEFHERTITSAFNLQPSSSFPLLSRLLTVWTFSSSTVREIHVGSILRVAIFSVTQVIY